MLREEANMTIQSFLYALEMDVVKNATDVLRWWGIFAILVSGFILYYRGAAVKALKFEVAALSGRVERLDGEVSRLRGTLILYGCRRAPDCDDWAKFVDDMNLDPQTHGRATD
jgi:hypothetical protein